MNNKEALHDQKPALHQKLCGFTVTRTAALTNPVGTLYQLRHDRTGADLVWLDRPDPNKTFCVAFQTVPEDDTGVFHIIEHSVLCGSDRYPVKDPFVELLKGSLNTVLNAITFSDKTMYPVSSRNDRDFYNLMRVYLDAVFFPAIYHNPNVFRQEGWHYELAEDGTLRRVGVVYGEMKGAFSSVDRMVYGNLNRMIFPDTTYGMESGGDPANIPDLTYEQFLAAHRRFYHPSNARIFLDGSLDLSAALAIIDGEYLSRFAPRPRDFAIGVQAPIAPTARTLTYEIAPGEDPKDKAHFALGKVIGSWQDAERITAVKILSDALFGSNSAPATRAILTAGLAQDVSAEVDDSIAQPAVYVHLLNCPDARLPEMQTALHALLRRVLGSGLDRAELTASLNRMEFQNRERNEPYGVELAVRAASAWMYGGDPEQYLDLSGVYAALRAKLEGSWFDDLAAEVFLSEDGFAALTLLPSNTLGREKAEAEAAELARIAAGWSEEQKAKIRAEQAELAAWQQQPDSLDALASIPHLERSDLSAEPLWTVCAEEQRGCVRILRPAIETTGTVYLNLYFALPPMALTELPRLALLSDLLGELPTRLHSREDLQREIKTWLGRLTFSVNPIGNPADPANTVCWLRAGCAVLTRNASRAVSLLREILLETNLDQPEAVREILQQSNLSATRRLIGSGHRYAVLHALSGTSAEAAANELLSGYGALQALRTAADLPDFPALRDGLAALLTKLPKLPLTVSVTGDLPESDLADLIAGFGGPQVGPTVTLTAEKAVRDSVVIPSGVAYAARCGNLARLGTAYHGSFALASKLVSLNYLWNEVRVQGGAYGCGIQISPSGTLSFYSYRDPNPARTLGVYRDCADWLRGFCDRRESFDQLLIGAVSDSEPLLSPEDGSRLAAEAVLRGVTLAQKRRERRELLDASYDDLLRFCDLLDRLDEHPNTCVVGGANLLDACGEAAGTRLD